MVDKLAMVKVAKKITPIMKADIEILFNRFVQIPGLFLG